MGYRHRSALVCPETANPGFATPVLSTLLLAAAGLAPFTATTVLASVLVAVGGYIAARTARTA
jgi:hypothetical protein